MTPIMEYLTTGRLLEERKDTRKILYQAPRYVIVDGILYRRGHSLPLLRCVLPKRLKPSCKRCMKTFVEIMLGGET